MSLLLIMAAAGATFIAGTHTNLSAEEARDLGIELLARNFEYELMDEPSPLFFRLDLSSFDVCKIRDVGIDVQDSSGTNIFGTTISRFNGPIYTFRLDRRYLNSTDMAIACDDGPDVLDRVYLFKLWDLLQEP